MRIFFILIFCLLTSLPSICSPLRANINFSIFNGSIILEVKDRSGKDLNILFDSGSNSLLLDNDAIPRLNLEIEYEGHAAFLNGSAKASYFSLVKVFDDELLNKLYTRGSCVDFDWLSKEKGIKIDGLIGLNSYMKVVVDIDFQKNMLLISETPFKESELSNFNKIKMIYTDSGKETRFSQNMKMLPACKIKFVISAAFTVETNMLFDTGFNKKFSLSTNLNVDSILNIAQKKYYSTQSKKISLGEEKYTLHTLSVDSILIDDLKSNFGNEIVFTEAHPMAIQVSGATNWISSCGVDFLRNFKSVRFDLINNYIYLLN